MGVITDMLARLTDRYSKGQNSNIGKVLQLVAGEIDELNSTIATVGIWRDVDQAEGTTLDLVGKMFSQQREGLSDESYRVMIKSKVLRDRSDGTLDTLIKNIAYLLQVDQQEVYIKGQSDKPASLYTQFELAKVDLMGLPVERMAEILNSITGAGVSMDIWFQGSFLFAESDAVENDADHGFSDMVSDQYYYQGDFTFSDVSTSKTDSEKGFSDADTGNGGKYGAMYTVEEQEKITAW
jgi:hypothetical protein